MCGQIRKGPAPLFAKAAYPVSEPYTDVFSVRPISHLLQVSVDITASVVNDRAPRYVLGKNSLGFLWLPRMVLLFTGHMNPQSSDLGAESFQRHTTARKRYRSSARNH